MNAIFEAEQGPLEIGQRGRKVTTRQADVPELADLVPNGIADCVRRSKVVRGIPMAHAFVQSIVQDRPPPIDVLTAANWTATGICAHESAMRGGAGVSIPHFDLGHRARMEEETP